MWSKEELEEHSFRVSAGNLCPLLHGMEKTGLVVFYEERDGPFNRKFYKAAVEGRKTLARAKKKVTELFLEYHFS